MPNGAKYWRMKYRFGGKEKRLSFGAYPEAGLKDARGKRDDARKLLASGADPGETRKAMKAAQIADAETFEVVAREWFAKNAASWAENHGNRIIRRLERDIFPWLGNTPVRGIDAPKLLGALRRIEERGAVETAHRALQNCGQVFRYAIATGRAERDISADLKGALPPVKGGHFAAVTDPKQVAELLRAIDAYQGTFTVQCALKLAPLFFVHPGELRMVAPFIGPPLSECSTTCPGRRPSRVAISTIRSPAKMLHSCACTCQPTIKGEAKYWLEPESLTEMQAGVGRVTTAEQLLVRSARAKTGLSQQAFAERIKTPVAAARLGTRPVCAAGRRVVPVKAHRQPPGFDRRVRSGVALFGCSLVGHAFYARHWL